jgi:hypothetical protein
MFRQMGIDEIAILLSKKTSHLRPQLRVSVFYESDFHQHSLFRD